MRISYKSLLATVGISALATVSVASSAASNSTLFAEHPSIVSQSVASGKHIKDLAIKDGKLYMGYGNYTANTGPIDIATASLATGATVIELDNTPTEEINVFRKFNGNLYSPWVDPTGWGGAVNGGMSNSVIRWHNEFTFPAGHVYDYTELGSSKFLVGAVAYGGAGVWQNNGSGWKLVRTEESPGGATGWERFYWAVTLNGKVYAQATHKGMQPGEELPYSDNFTMRVYDGRSWRNSNANVSGVFEASDIEVFKNKAYFKTSVFDGKRVVRSGLNFIPIDFYNDGVSLYVISSNGLLAKTSDGRTWQSLPQFILPTGNVRSVAVHNGVIYAGNTLGQVYKKTL